MKYFCCTLLCVLICVSTSASIVTHTYVDDFSGETLRYQLSKPDAYSVMIENQRLKLATPLTNIAGRVFAYSDWNNVLTPFKGSLDSIKADSVSWSFNLRQNYATATNKLGGFASGKRGVAVILTADDTNLLSANGYAIVMGGNGLLNYRLVRYHNGLTADDHLTDIISGSELSTPKGYMAMRVVFLPNTHTWRFYLSEGNTSDFTDPLQVKDYLCYGEAKDSTFTANALKAFAFHLNAAATTKTSFNIWVDNYRMTTYTDYLPKPDVPIKEHTLELPLCWSSHAVIQRDQPIQIWGWAAKEDTIVVRLSRQGVNTLDSAIVDSLGRWQVTLPAQSVCSQASQITVTVKGTVLKEELTDLLFGDVWMAVGQSNMEKRVDHLTEAAQYIKEANQYPLIRYYRSGYNPSVEPRDRAKGNPWFVCDSSQIINASAVAYVFARHLQEELQIPIGITGAYRGGTDLETWLSGDKIENDPELAFVKGRKAIADPTSNSAYPSLHYNGQIHPVKDLAVKGVIYYQGENNTKRGLEFRFMLRKMAESFREMKHQPNLPFYQVQMFNVGPTSTGIYEENNWCDTREQQNLLQHDPLMHHSGMAVIIETNEQSKNTDESVRMHPHTKKPVGERLAALALHEVYGKDIACYSPELKRFYVQSDTMFIVMDHVYDGLTIQNDSSILAGFVLSDSTRNFKQATAVIINDSTVALHTDEVTSPHAARYAWSKDPVCNLANSTLLPASPFRTDIWPSKASFTPSAYTAPASSDNTLMAVRINGIWMKAFSNDQINYEIEYNESFLPYVAAYVNHPTAKISIGQVTNMDGSEAERTTQIVVTAENGSVRTFRILFQKHLTKLSTIRQNHATRGIFTVQGQYMGTEIPNESHGLYITDHGKIVR